MNRDACNNKHPDLYLFDVRFIFLYLFNESSAIAMLTIWGYRHQRVYLRHRQGVSPNRD